MSKDVWQDIACVFCNHRKQMEMQNPSSSMDSQKKICGIHYFCYLIDFLCSMMWEGRWLMRNHWIMRPLQWPLHAWYIIIECVSFDIVHFFNHWGNLAYYRFYHEWHNTGSGACLFYLVPVSWVNMECSFIKHEHIMIVIAVLLCLPLFIQPWLTDSM